LVGGWTRSKELFRNVIILFLISITTGRTNFKFQTFAKPRSLWAIFGQLPIVKFHKVKFRVIFSTNFKQQNL